jgi:hypothetical protein
LGGAGFVVWRVMMDGKEKTEKVCPLMTGSRDELEYCYKTGCAWWDRQSGKCAVLMLAQEVRVVSDDVSCINAKWGSR